MRRARVSHNRHGTTPARSRRDHHSSTPSATSFAPKPLLSFRQALRVCSLVTAPVLLKQVLGKPSFGENDWLVENGVVAHKKPRQRQRGRVLGLGKPSWARQSWGKRAWRTPGVARPNPGRVRRWAKADSARMAWGKPEPDTTRKRQTRGRCRQARPPVYCLFAYQARLGCELPERGRKIKWSNISAGQSLARGLAYT